MGKHQLLSMEQVAKLLKVSLKTVYRWVEAGELPVSQLGKKTYRIFGVDLLKFLNSKKVNPAPQAYAHGDRPESHGK